MDEPMTDIESIVVRWLQKNKIDFQFQTSLSGGYYSLGGSVVDILIPDRDLAWRIHGEYWHRGVVAEGRDLVQKEMLMGLGFTVVDIFGDDIRERPDETMRMALQGRELL